MEHLITLLLVLSTILSYLMLKESGHEPKVVGGQPIIKHNVHDYAQKLPKHKVQKLSKVFRLPIDVALQNVKGSNNAAMIARSMAVTGTSGFHIIGAKATDMRAAVGAQNYVKIAKVGDIDPSTYFTNLGLYPILVEQGGEPLETFNFKSLIRQGKQICIVMGNESSGLSSDYLNQPFPRITISQYGLLRSHNVQVAASIVMYEFSKQWRQVQMGKL